MFRRILSNWIAWFAMFSIVVLGLLFYLGLGLEVESSVTKQVLSQEQMIARAEASNIIIFFQKFSESVAILAQLSSVENRSTGVVHDLEAFVELQRDGGIINGVVLTDKNGVVQFDSGTKDFQSISNQDYFVWAKTKGEKGQYFISQPVISKLGVSSGESIIVVASPVFKNNVFTGVVASSVQLFPLVERFFKFMKISDLTEMYLVDVEGNILYSNFSPDEIGQNISELFAGDQDQSLRDRIKNSLGATQEDQFQTENHLITYAPVKLGVQSLLLIISSPTEKVEDLTRQFYIRQTAILIFTSFTILAFAAIAIRKINFEKTPHGSNHN